MPDAPSTSDGNPPMQEQLDQYRDYLRFLADVKLDRRLRGRIDASDIVQETMVKACAAWDQCTGEAAGQRVAWLRQILMRTILHAVRDERRAKRDVGREQRLDRALDESTRRIECFLAADQTSPSVSLQQAQELKQSADAR